MATSILSCSPCTIHHITIPSIVWCTECDEGLCSQCQKHHAASKGSRNHNTLPITEYQELPSEVQQINHYCDKHNEKYTIYCKKHECPCCGSCIVEDHIGCQELYRLSDIIDKSETAKASIEIQQSLSDLAENIKRIRQNRENNLKTLSDNKLNIEQKIKETRTRINCYIDKMQDEVMKILKASDEKERRLISMLLTALDRQELEISEYQRNIEKINQHATDLQTFMSMKQLEKEVSCKKKNLQSIVDSDTLKEIVLSYCDKADIREFGYVIIEKKPCNLIVRWKKDKQDQMMSLKLQNRSVENINLKLHKTVDTGKFVIRGCCMLPDGRMAFACDGLASCVKVFNTDGSKDFEVNHVSGAFDLAYINQDNTLAVTSGRFGRQCITIIDIQNKQIKKEISVESCCYGIAVKDDKLICSAREKGIIMINPYTNTSRVIVRTKLSKESYLAHFGENYFHTCRKTNSVICYNLHGTLQWTFKNDSVLKNIGGITVDNSGNVYVTGNISNFPIGIPSNIVVVLSPDEQKHKTVLTASDGLANPFSLDYCRSRNQLLVANYCTGAMVYTLVK